MFHRADSAGFAATKPAFVQDWHQRGIKEDAQAQDEPSVAFPCRAMVLSLEGRLRVLTKSSVRRGLLNTMHGEAQDLRCSNSSFEAAKQERRKIEGPKAVSSALATAYSCAKIGTV